VVGKGGRGGEGGVLKRKKRSCHDASSLWLGDPSSDWMNHQALRLGAVNPHVHIESSPFHDDHEFPIRSPYVHLPRFDHPLSSPTHLLSGDG